MGASDGIPGQDSAPFVPEFDFPPYVVFEITTSCPHRCLFCEADLPNYRPSSPQLTFAEQVRVLRKVAEAGTFRVFLTGGEPLLHPRFADLYGEATALGLRAVTSTCAYHLDEERVASLVAAGVDHLQVSLHGVGEVHDAVVGVAGSYQRVAANLLLLHKAGIRTEVACVGISENFGDLPDLVRESSRLGVSFLRVLRYLPAHRREMLRHVPPQAMVKRTLPRLQAAAREARMRIAVGVCPGYGEERTRDTYAAVHPAASFCHAGKTQLSILADGRVVPCIVFRHRPELVVGSILVDSLDDMWNCPVFRRFRLLTPADYTGMCGSCERKWKCYSARCVAYNLSGDLAGDDYTCYNAPAP